MSIYQKLKSAHDLAQQQGKFLLVEATINPSKRVVMIIVDIDEEFSLTGLRVRQDFSEIFACPSYDREDWLNIRPLSQLSTFYSEPPNHLRTDRITAVSGVLIDPKYLSQHLKDAIARASDEPFPVL